MLTVIRRARSLDIVDALTVGISFVTLATWALAIAHRGFDYDELEHAHDIWLIKGGLRPYADFFECHPPFLWYPLSLVFRGFGDTYTVLFALRVITAIGHLGFLVSTWKNVALSFRRLPSALVLPIHSFCLAVLVMAAQADIIGYLLEFRLDAWPNALLFFAVYRYRVSRPDAPFQASLKLGLLCTAAILCSPKLLVFVALFVMASLFRADKRALRMAGLAAGGATALVCGVGFTLALRVNPIDVYHLTISYHNLLNTKGGFGHGLARALFNTPLPLAIVIAGVGSWLLLVRARWFDSPFEVSVLGFLGLQVLIVSFGYKQYSVPWFMMGIVFVPFIEQVLHRVRWFHSAVVALAILYATMGAVDAHRMFESSNEARADIEFRRWLETQVSPAGFVVAGGDSNPLFRRDVFYQMTISTAPNGFDTASIVAEMKLKPFSDKVTLAYYRRELQDHPPDLIVLNGWFTAQQKQAIDEYIGAHATEYRRVSSPRNPVMVRRH